MKQCRQCGITKGLSDFHKDKSRKDGLRNVCKGCVNTYMQAHYVVNRDKKIARALQWVEVNRARHNKKCNEWAKNNRDKVNSRTARRYAAKTKATPRWLTAEDLWLITEAYTLAKLRTELFGCKWEVDHIVPLRGVGVSGLHVPWNLQVIPAKANRRKSNSWGVA